MTRRSLTPRHRVLFCSLLSCFLFILVTQAKWVFYLFYDVSKKVCFIFFVVFTTLVDANLKKKRELLEKRRRPQLNWQMAWEVS